MQELGMDDNGRGRRRAGDDGTATIEGWRGRGSARRRGRRWNERRTGRRTRGRMRGIMERRRRTRRGMRRIRWRASEDREEMGRVEPWTRPDPPAGDGLLLSR